MKLKIRSSLRLLYKPLRWLYSGNNIHFDLSLTQAPHANMLFLISLIFAFFSIACVSVGLGMSSHANNLLRTPAVLTVTLPTVDQGHDHEIGAVVAALENINGAAFARHVELNPSIWGAGVSDGNDRLRLPEFLDLTFNPGIVPDLAHVRSVANRISPGASVVETSNAAAASIRSLRFYQAVLFAGALICLFFSIFAITLITARSWHFHHREWWLLASLGAPKDYILGQFKTCFGIKLATGTLAGFGIAVFVLLSCQLLMQAPVVKDIVVIDEPFQALLLITSCMVIMLCQLFALFVCLDGIWRRGFASSW